MRKKRTKQHERGRKRKWLKMKVKYKVYVVYGRSDFKVSMLTFYILYKELIID